MSILYFENGNRSYKYNSEERTLWLLGQDTCMEIDDPVFIARVRAGWKVISRKQALDLANRKDH